MEIVIDSGRNTISEVHVNPHFPGLAQLLVSLLVGKEVSGIRMSEVESLDECYLSPFRAATKMALLQALEAYDRAKEKGSEQSATRQNGLAIRL